MLLYVHIPFCESKCPYCAFGSVVGKENLAGKYFNAIISDFDAQINKFNIKKGEISTLFIGGGTPSDINVKFYERLFDKILPFLSDSAEITSEANPNSSTLEWLKNMRNFGVNRISFGAQSFFDDKLKFLGRIHDSSQIYKAVENAKFSGFDNINVDLIYATKLDNKKRLSMEIEHVKNLEISHLSAYSLTLEPKTPFYKKTQYKKDSEILARHIIKEIENIGLKQYEISNFGQICKHNLGYWSGKNYMAVGAYSVGFSNNYRFYAKTNLDDYIKDPLQKNYEYLTDDEMALERVFLGFRSIIGLEKSSLKDSWVKNAEILRKSKKLIYKNGRYYAKNFLVADSLAIFLTQ